MQVKERPNTKLRIEKMTDIPKEKLSEVIALYALESTDVASYQQPNGLWTVEAKILDSR